MATAAVLVVSMIDDGRSNLLIVAQRTQPVH